MAMSIPFDTLDYAKKLETAGVPASQAEAQAKILADVLGRAVAFPHDLSALERNLSTQIKAVDLRVEKVEQRLESKMDVGFAKVEGSINLLKWMIGFTITLNVAVFLKLFIH
ncbi:hypothetical protein [Uliginosibacterium gangwonense]|uniref:hypothetical protein n=1 Tax=Uliginosibacterium gangwonense TaxID=392736 RepID=UPI00037C06BD|nr:hypothetical protein [Uliginosibacterium gangwonense]